MEIIGHRGAAGLAPENSLEAIKRALEFGVDCIELDVRVHSGVLYLSHDETIRTKDYTSLEQALKEINGKVPINLEIKEDKVVDLLPKTLENYTGRIIYSSFKYNILHAIRDSIPGAEIAVIEKWSGVRAVAQASLLDTKRIHINHQWLWSKFVMSMKSRGYKLYVYTVNDKERAKELKSWGVSGIFTDRPDIFL